MHFKHSYIRGVRKLTKKKPICGRLMTVDSKALGKDVASSLLSPTCRLFFELGIINTWLVLYLGDIEKVNIRWEVLKKLKKI